MTDERLTDGQIEQILTVVEERLGRSIAQESHESLGARGAPSGHSKRQSQQAPAYEKQLHIWVTEEDKNWFYSVARARNLKSGAFVSYLRSLYDAQQLVTQL
ncbi:hypothetical protein [Shimia sp. MIT1388]|uniref:hypothetical protein n=1 Tax=Shimia sp. MIT1388 TaxID=3096992 RepID=UPI00399A1FA5